MVAGRQSKIPKDLLLHSVIQGFSVYLFRHFDVGELTRSPSILMNNTKELCSVRGGLSGKAIRKLDAVVQVEE